MIGHELNLNRVSLDGFLVRRRSATLHFGASDRPATRESSWWVYLACERSPGRFEASAEPVSLSASLVSGREIHGTVRIIERRDDAYGSELILAGLELAI